MQYLKYITEQLLTLYSYVASAFSEMPNGTIVSLNTLEQLLEQIEAFNDIQGFHTTNPRMMETITPTLNSHRILEVLRKINIVAWTTGDITEFNNELLEHAATNVKTRTISWYDFLEDGSGEPITHYEFISALHEKLSTLNATLRTRRTEEECTLMLSSLYMVVSDIYTTVNSLRVYVNR